MADKTVTLADAEWQQLVAIIAQTIGYIPFQKLVSQLQAQEEPLPVKGDGLDHEAPDGPASLRRVPRA